MAIPAYAQIADDLFFYGRRAPAVGPRLTAMGGASVAGLADWSGSYANPAGLAYLNTRQAVISGHGYAQGIETGGLDVDVEAEGASLNMASYATPIPTQRGALAVGGGYHETAVYTRGLSDGRGGLGIYSANESGTQGELSVAGAVAVGPRVMVGLSANAPLGIYEFEERFFDGDAGDNPSFDAEFAGANLRAGVSIQATPTVRIGATLESPTFFQIKESGPAFEEYEYEIMTPWRASAGFMVSSPRSIFSADFEFVDWSQARFLTDDPYFDGENAIARRSFNPVLNTRFGGEFLLGSVALRAGAAFQPDPRFESFETETIRRHYSAGIGVRVAENARIDAAFIHTQLADGPRGQVFDDEGYYLWEADHSFRNAIQVGVDMRF